MGIFAKKIQQKPPQSFTTKDWERLVSSFAHNAPNGINRLEAIASSMKIPVERFYQNPSYSLLFEAVKQGKAPELISTLGFSGWSVDEWNMLLGLVEKGADLGQYALTDKDKEALLKQAEANEKAKQLEEENKKKSNTILYIGIGLVVLLVLYFIFKKK